MTYGERILMARRRAGRLTQRDVAQQAGLHPAVMVDIERGRLEITEQQFQQIMAAIAVLSERPKAEAVA